MKMRHTLPGVEEGPGRNPVRPAGVRFPGPALRIGERCHVCKCLLWPIGPGDPGCQHTCCHPDPYVRG